MFQTLNTFKELFLGLLPTETYNIVKDLKIELASTEVSEVLKEKDFMECVAYYPEEKVVITCDVKTEVLLKGKHLNSLERACLVFDCTSLEFKQDSSNDLSTDTTTADKLNFMYKNL